MHLSLSHIHALSLAALRGSGASELQAVPVADSMRDAEAEGLRNVGLAYLPTYCEHLRCGKVRGDAVPRVTEGGAAVLRVDAAHGFSHPAFVLALPRFTVLAHRGGIAALAISHSYSAGVVGWFVQQLAANGLVGLGFANTSASVAPWGGKRPLLGTNPIAFAAPRPSAGPVVVDISTSATAYVRVTDAAARGERLPGRWVVDSHGQATQDPKALIAGGTIAPVGGHKGYGLGLLVEILAAGVTGANWSYEASSFGGNEGGPPDVGQLFIALDPKLTGGQRLGLRIAQLSARIDAEPGARLPGDGRHAQRQRAEREGIEVPDELIVKVRRYAARDT